MQIEMSSHASTHLSVYLTTTDRICVLDRQDEDESKFFGQALVDDAAMRRRPTTDLARGGEQHTNRAPAASSSSRQTLGIQ
jgi:hypothetical protein